MKKPRKLQKRIMLFAAVWMTAVFLLAGCGSGGVSVGTSAQQSGGNRDARAQVLVPQSPEERVIGEDGQTAVIDVSNVSDGYVTVRYTGNNEKVKLKITCEGQEYTYDLRQGVADVFPLTCGNGTYQFGVFENIGGNQYSTLLSGSADVEIRGEFLPYLYPNQYIAFTADSAAVAQGEQLAQGAADDLDVVARVYDYVVGTVTYDYDKADTVQTGYLPDVDETLQTEKGICFDYAALMTAMLRSQRIPTKLVIGYVSGGGGQVYHAWISVYIEGQGWVDNIIYFDGTDWVRMDPTMASTGGGAGKYTGDGNQYNAMYTY
ncbi:MAG: transglutaminase-like domain-containing protein [Christensenella sp.]|nr:transglutaminase-like domain-containing protein [Christensenella sp.]